MLKNSNLNLGRRLLQQKQAMRSELKLKAIANLSGIWADSGHLYTSGRISKFGTRGMWGGRP